MDLGQQITVGNRPNGFYSFPDNWRLCSLGEITTSSQYGISSSSGGNYSVPILKMNNLQDGHIDLGDLDYIQLSKAEMESLILNKGDLLINRTNSFDLVGKAAIYDLAGEHVFASYLVRFRLGPSVLPAFVNYFLNSEPGQHKLKLLSTKAVSQANINPSILKMRFFVPVPPLPEQQAIATALSDVDALIASLDRLIAKKRDIKQATMQQLLTGKTRLPGFSGEWSTKYLRDISFMKGRIGWQGLKQSEFTMNADEPYLITGMNFKNGKIRWDEVYHVSNERYEIAKDIQLESNDILMTKDGTIGKLLFVDIIPFPGNATLNSHLLVFRPIRDSYDPKFLYYQLTSKAFKDYIELSKSGSTFFGISQESVGNYPVFLPPTKSEQTVIANILSDMDAEIAALEQKHDKTRALKQGMMQELLTGKTRLV